MPRPVTDPHISSALSLSSMSAEVSLRAFPPSCPLPNYILAIILSLYSIYEHYIFHYLMGSKMAKDSPADKALSPVALDLLKRLGHGIRTARSRRGIRQEDLATRTSMSRVRLRKLEKGDPTVGLGALVQVLEILGLLEQFSAIADPEKDKLGLALEARERKSRVDVKVPKDDLDF